MERWILQKSKLRFKNIRNLETKYKFLNTHALPNLNQDYINNIMRHKQILRCIQTILREKPRAVWIQC